MSVPSDLLTAEQQRQMDGLLRLIIEEKDPAKFCALVRELDSLIKDTQSAIIRLHLSKSA